MTPLEQRLRSALAAEAELWPAPSALGISHRAPRGVPRGWITAAATAAAVLVLVAGSVWMVDRFSSTDTETASRSLSAVPPIEVGMFSQVTGGNEFGVEPLSEEPDKDGEILATTIVHDVAANSEGAVAVGILDGNGGGIGAIWYARDGSQWQRVPHEDALFGVPGEAPNTMIIDVAASDSEFLAVGVRFTEPRERIVWRSEDGLNWTRREGPGFDASAVIATDAGWTVVGSNDLQGAVWHSVDGLTWQAAPDDDFVSGTHSIALLDVAHDGERFVAVGSSSALQFREDRAVVWVSEDGLAWDRIEDETDVFDIPAADGIEQVIVGPSGFVGIGEERIAEGDEPAFGLAWFSADGLEWERIRLGDRDTGRPLSITASQAGYVIYGAQFDESSVASRLWTSTDGLSWDVVDPEGLEDHQPGTALLVDRRLLIFASMLRDSGDIFSSSGYGEGVVWAADL